MIRKERAFDIAMPNEAIRELLLQRAEYHRTYEEQVEGERVATQTGDSCGVEM